jgi:hypothetical protein
MDLNELLARCVEVEKEAILAAFSTQIDAIPFFVYQQESFPYFTHRIAGDEIGSEGNEIDRDSYTVIIREVIGHITQGYMGEVETLLYEHIPVIKTAFNTNEGLTSAVYPDDMEALIEGDTARMLSHSGFRIFQDSGLIGVTQVGVDYVLTCLFHEDLY